MFKSLCNAMVGTKELQSCWMYAGIAGLYILFDVAYYLRGVATLFTWTVYSRVVGPAAINAHILRANLVSPCWSWGLCWFTDLDLMFHMNNARYLRECDFARYKFLISCGLGPALRRTGYTMVLGASTIRYRRSIGLFDRFTVATKVLSWDEKSLYIEHTFHRSKDNFVCAIVMVKQSLVNGTIDALFKAALTPHSVQLQQQQIVDDEVVAKDIKEVLDSPAFPEELSKWIESNNISSQKLNPQRQNEPLNHSDHSESQGDNASPKARLRHVTEEKGDTLAKENFSQFYSLSPSRIEGVEEDDSEDSLDAFPQLKNGPRPSYASQSKPINGPRPSYASQSQPINGPRPSYASQPTEAPQPSHVPQPSNSLLSHAQVLKPSASLEQDARSKEEFPVPPPPPPPPPPPLLPHPDAEVLPGQLSIERTIPPAPVKSTSPSSSPVDDNNNTSSRNSGYHIEDDFLKTEPLHRRRSQENCRKRVSFLSSSPSRPSAATSKQIKIDGRKAASKVLTSSVSEPTDLISPTDVLVPKSMSRFEAFSSISGNFGPNASFAAELRHKSPVPAGLPSTSASSFPVDDALRTPSSSSPVALPSPSSLVPRPPAAPPCSPSSLVPLPPAAPSSSPSSLVPLPPTSSTTSKPSSIEACDVVIQTSFFSYPEMETDEEELLRCSASFPSSLGFELIERRSKVSNESRCNYPGSVPHSDMVERASPLLAVEKGSVRLRSSPRGRSTAFPDRKPDLKGGSTASPDRKGGSTASPDRKRDLENFKDLKDLWTPTGKIVRQDLSPSSMGSKVD